MANEMIQMRIVSINEDSFEMYPGKMDDDSQSEEIQIGFSTRIQTEETNDLFTLHFGTRYMLGNELILESVYRFVFEVKNLKNFITYKDDQTITINGLMPHLLNVAVGTMRGILVVKTAGTSLSKFPLPIIDANKLSISLSNSQQPK
jgi:hypothetical protein